MLYGLLLTLYILICFLLMILILIQKSKGSLGLGTTGGGMQMLFGGSGGQSFFQKATWVLGALFMLSSLGLAIIKSRTTAQSRFLTPATQTERPAPQPTRTPLAPTQAPVQTAEEKSGPAEAQ
ncbi:MAG: Preprotein translocase, SecG subunit [candidate division TM6 bacterium GW2011_GWE2_42_60]|nr:MAG: Preprotein translocase, SecG subunit [candidate division TM6 bacterium GW2011_GWE2_42_60]HBY05819.1 preprotein translocase subunit SecG [Candidatus Dependentiae bacterium]